MFLSAEDPDVVELARLIDAGATRPLALLLADRIAGGP